MDRERREGDRGRGAHYEDRDRRRSDPWREDRSRGAGGWGRSGTEEGRGHGNAPLPSGGRQVETHYDSQAFQHQSRSQAMAVRNSGALISYKKFANAVKRRQIAEYAGGATLLVDLGCGRGGDLQKWQEAGGEALVESGLLAMPLLPRPTLLAPGCAAHSKRAVEPLGAQQGAVAQPRGPAEAADAAASNTQA